MTDDHAPRPAIDLDETPLFSLDGQHEPDPDDEDLHPRDVSEPEGVPLPFDVLECGNGELPDHLLRPIGVGHHRLHANAAAGFERLRRLAAGAGIDLTCTDSYRPLAEQIDLKRRKPTLAATPGRSVHGWGFAVDVSIGSPPKPFGMSVLTWLNDHAPTVGWHLGRPADEPWHWVYRGTPDAPSDAAVPGAAAAASAAGATMATSDRTPAAPVRVVRALLGLEPSDVFDESADAAARAFQTEHGLFVDGIVGPKTWAALLQATAPADRSEVRLDSQGDSVAWVQRRLGITADGEFGPVTDRTVREFQRSAGLVADGRVGPKTWAALVG